MTKRPAKAKKPDKLAELQQIARSVDHGLSDPHDGFIYIPQQEANMLKAAFESFFSGKAKTLDAAFGVKRERGAPKRGPSPRVLDRLMAAALSGKTLEELADENEVGARTLQRSNKRHEEAVLRELAKKLVQNLHNQRNDKK